MKLTLILLGLFGFAAANIFEDGMEYEFMTDTHVGAGTMDFAPHVSGFSYKYKTRLQVAGQKINVHISELKFSEYNGKFEPSHIPFLDTTYTDRPMEVAPFSVELDDHGVFKSLTHDSSVTVAEKNIIKGWAQKLQINMPKSHTEKGFKSKEKSLFGTCDVTYAVTEDQIIKSVAHMKDCEHRVYYKSDDWQGHRCDGHHAKENPEGLYSSANTVFKVEKKGDRYYPHVIVSTSMLVGQFFESDGVSHYAHSNSTSVLVSAKQSPGDISASGTTTEDLDFEFQLKGLKWNDERDLKAQEPHFATGKFFEEDQATIMAEVKKRIAASKEVVEHVSHDKEHVQKAHGMGIGMIIPPLMALNYDSLKSLFDEYSGDKSEDGIYRFNVFNELLSSLGTSASAVLIKDMVLAKKFDNYRDSVRILSAVPFHIQHPNIQLLDEYEQLFAYDGELILKETIPLVFGSMVRRTCESAGEVYTDEAKKCFESVAKKYIDKYYKKLIETDDHHEQINLIPILHNIKYGGVADTLKPFIYGETKVKCAQLRAYAIYAAAPDATAKGYGAEYFLPIFADHHLDHELRIAAFNMLMHAHPTSTDFNTIMVTLYTEEDYEVINYVHTALESMAHSINPCNKETSELAEYFLKYLKQYSGYESEFGLGISKMFFREFNQKKYGYGGSYTYAAIGSHKSTTPISIWMDMSSYLFHSYQVSNFGIHLRIEGLAKGLIRKFKKMDPTVWKIEDLEKILYQEMGIQAKEDQKIRVEIGLYFKHSCVAYRQYDQDSIKEGGNIKNLVDDLMGLGDTYSIHHQRVLNVGALSYQQPTEFGVPATFVNTFSAMFDVDATVKKGILRGLIFRDVTYKMNAFGQGQRTMMVSHPILKTSYGIIQDRIYQGHFPRNFVLGFNVVKKEIKFSVERPSYEEPLEILMHSQNMVFARSHTLVNNHDITSHCPKCTYRTIVSMGPDAAKTRVFLERENKVVGSYLHGEYFDCELDNNRGKALYHAMRAFSPYNKNPKTTVNLIRMGLRQIKAYFTFFPRAEKCGAMFRWSQSKTNPVKKLEFSARFNREENGQRLFFRGRKLFMKSTIKAIGEPADRYYKLNVAYEFTPGNIKNNFKVQFTRIGVPNLMDDYSMCFNLENEYPDFSEEFMDYDKENQMEVTGKARLQYGKASKCDAAPGEVRMTFKHETTAESRESLKNSWYYKQCMEQAATPAWADRGSRLPVTHPCFLTVKDATTARQYSVNVDFVKLTDRMNAIISQVQAAVKIGFLPYWDIDPEVLPASSSDPHMTMKATFKDHDKALDLYMETSQGGQKFTDIPLSLNWVNRMRGLKFSKTIQRLMKMKIISPCVVTNSDVKTYDNTTFHYDPSSCWTLTSAHCAPKPSYAVFTKKSAGHPLAAKIYLGGHSIEFQPSGPKKFEVLIDGAATQIGDKEYVHKEGTDEIFKVYKWGHTYNIYSFLKLWVNYDGHYVSIVPAPSVKGQHCGICGNYNRNHYDEFEGKDGKHLTTAAEFVDSYKWKC